MAEKKVATTPEEVFVKLKEMVDTGRIENHQMYDKFCDMLDVAFDQDKEDAGELFEEYLHKYNLV